jgi:hypothetical protein
MIFPEPEFMRRRMSARFHHVALIASVVFLGGSNGAVPDPHPSATRPPSDARSLECNADPDLHSLVTTYLKPGVALLVGEMHGTQQSPQFVRDVACSALLANEKRAKKLAITIALEIPSDESPELQAFMNHRSTDDESSYFLRSKFWNSPFQDGRRSQAMKSLLEAIRSWHAQHLPVRLLPIDEPAKHGEQRDAAMAQHLADDIKKNRGNVLYVVLTGNIHSSLDRGTPWDPNYAPMGLALADLVGADRRIISLQPHYYGGGSAYICESSESSSCRETPISRRPRNDGDTELRGVKVVTPVSFAHLQGYYYFSTPVQSSDPAVFEPHPGSG